MYDGTNICVEVYDVVVGCWFSSGNADSNLGAGGFVEKIRHRRKVGRSNA